MAMEFMRKTLSIMIHWQWKGNDHNDDGDGVNIDDGVNVDGDGEDDGDNVDDDDSKRKSWSKRVCLSRRQIRRGAAKSAPPAYYY